MIVITGATGQLGRLVIQSLLKTVPAAGIVADGVNKLRSPERSFLIITHYQRLLDYIKPDVVHVLAKGKIVKTGGPELAKELEATGYAEFSQEAA